MSISARMFRRVVVTLLIIYWITVFTATHLPPSKLPQTHVSDKIEHFSAYFLLAGLLHLSLWQTRRPLWMLAAIVLVVGMAYGAMDELTQPPFGRTCDIHDWYADSVGTAAAVVVMSTARRLVRS